jgi:hypothetical protein
MTKIELRVFWSGFLVLAFLMILAIGQSLVRSGALCDSDLECQEYCQRMQWDHCDLPY